MQINQFAYIFFPNPCYPHPSPVKPVLVKTDTNVCHQLITESHFGMCSMCTVFLVARTITCQFKTKQNQQYDPQACKFINPATASRNQPQHCSILQTWAKQTIGKPKPRSYLYNSNNPCHPHLLHICGIGTGKELSTSLADIVHPTATSIRQHCTQSLHNLSLIANTSEA